MCPDSSRPTTPTCPILRCRRNGSRSAPRGIAVPRSKTASTNGMCLPSAQAICEYRKQQGIDGPLFLGIDTHALSVPACASALEVLAANGVDVMIADKDEYTPTPVISHAILAYNRGRDYRAGGRHRHHAVAQSARQRRLQVQPAQRRAGGQGRHGMDRSPCQCVAGKRPPGREKNVLRAGAARRDHAPARLSQCLRKRSRQRARHGCDSRREHPHGGGSAGRRRRSLLGPDCRALWLESHGRERQRSIRPSAS